MLPAQVAVTLLTFIATSILAWSHGSAAIASDHIIFAIGIVPLILAAMVHFVPVLARSITPGKFIRLLPLAALFGGGLITSYFAFPQALPAGRPVGAAIVMMAVASLGIWTYRMRSRAIGTPHPCLDWYLAAMTCLFVAVGAILLGYFMPAQRVALRLLHLHLNTLGFIGITALGTLQVLLPTAAGRPDPVAAVRMRQQLKWVVAGTVMTACGAAWLPDLAWIGVILLTVPFAGIFTSWLRIYAKDIFKLHGAVPSLAAALCGYAIAVIIGTAQASHYPGINPVASFIVAFLMPLVTGAVSQLLPLWLRPGRQTAWHQAARVHMGFGGGLRAMIFLAGGLVAGLGDVIGWYLASCAATLFLAQTLLLFIRRTAKSGSVTT
jgi:hypothetical protein